MAYQNDRYSLITEILEEVRRVIGEELVDAPTTLTDADRKTIEDELIGETNQTLEALTFAEMRSEGAQASHLARIRPEAQQLLRTRRR
jgi:hypothetical protein